MKRTLIGIAVFATACGTSEIEEGSLEMGIQTPAPSSVEHGRADHLAASHLIDLRLPLAFGCDGESLADVVQTHSGVGEPTLQETFGPDGCIDEQWVREWDGDKLLREDYDFFDPNLGKFTYMQPFAYEATFEYDAAGRGTKETRTMAGESDAFSISTTTYDADGRKLEELQTTTQQNGLPFEWERRQTWSYNAAGDVVLTESFANGALTTRTRTVYDEFGRLIEEHRTNDGVEHLTLRNTWDANDLLSTTQRFRPRDGAAISTTQFERRVDGTKLRTTETSHANGWINVHEFDVAEREVLYTQDSDLDGVADYRRETVYDAAGNMIRHTTAYGFHEANGPRVGEITRRFDSQNREIESLSRQSWLRGDTRRTRTSYDAIGGGYLIEVDLISPDGAVTPTEASRHLDAERELWRLYDANRDGQLESLTLNRWNGSRLLEVLQDHDGNGFVDSVQQWHFDAFGQLTDEMRDMDGDGVVDQRTTYRR